MTGKVSFFFFIALVPPLVFLCLYGGRGSYDSSYITLSVDAKRGGKEISALLEKNGIAYFSASRQEAFLSEFNKLEEVPLDEYFKRIETFDPRNDGYAEKALSIFMDGNEERIFIPTKPLYGLGGGGEEKLLSVLKNADYKALKKGEARRINIPDIILFVLSALALVFLAKKLDMPYIQNTQKSIKLYYIVVFLPSFALLINFGAAGFALCALSLAVFQILSKEAQTPLKALRRHLKIILPLVILFILIAAAGRLPLVLVLFYLLFFSLAFFAFTKAERISRKLPARAHFIAAPILPKKRLVIPFKRTVLPLKYPLLPLPFICAALLELVFSLFIRSGAVEIKSSDFKIPRESLVNEVDWAAHYEFQKNFSYVNLNGGAGGYLCYNTDADGLISGGQSALPSDAGAAPPFPLKELVAFLSGK